MSKFRGITDAERQAIKKARKNGGSIEAEPKSSNKIITTYTFTDAMKGGLNLTKRAMKSLVKAKLARQLWTNFWVLTKKGKNEFED